MTFALWTPPNPVVPLGAGSTDEERFIERRCWDLAAIQQALLAGSLSVELTSTAAFDAAQMGWRVRDVCNFFQLS